ncbi:hypothetical protein [Longivirga aurantiaca]|uniref:Cbb3-type cytochrome oxidase component FixQ n=1 Tax=Longivirga aurantiaca TaxID=1837743 RepID=A0ABW1SY37_9ACTN
MNHLWLLAAAVSPSPSPSSTEPAIDPDRVSPGILGFLAVVFLALAMVVIWKSMNKQLTGIDFDENDTENPRYTRKKAERAAQRAAAEGALPTGDAPGAPDA